MTTWWCEHAVLPGGLARGVTITADGGRISAIGVDGDAPPVPGPPPGAVRLDGLTVPGFANAHSHAFHRALRARVQAGRGTFWTWRDAMYRAAERLDPDSYHRLARATFAEMAQAGMAAVGEFHYLHHRPGGAPYADPNAMGRSLLAAAAEAGIRITLLDTLYLHGALGPGGHRPPAGAQLRYDDRSVARWVDRVDRLVDGERHRIGLALHSVRAVDPDAMGVAAGWADGRSAPVHAHVSEQVAENERCLEHLGASPVGVLERAGVLGSRFTAVHATHVGPADIAALAGSRSLVCLCPTTEQDLGDGAGPAAELVEAGVDLCLGSDSHATVDHLIEARTVELQDRARLGTRGLHRPADLLRMATGTGHRSLGWADSGALAVGNRADLTTLSLRSVRTAGAPAELAVEAAVFAATAADVTSVVVDGEAVVSDGRHRRVDVAAELESAIEELLP